MEAQDVAIVILAAGNARRFGSDKLMAELDGLPLGMHSAGRVAKLNAAAHFAVCQAASEIAAQYAKLGYDIIDNHHADIGLSGSLHLAVEAASGTGAQALLIMLADMPFVQAAQIAALIAACNDDIIASSDGKNAMPPAIFPRSSWHLLLETKGDTGARQILEHVQRLNAPAGTLRDIDTPGDLAASKAQPHRIDPAA